VLEIDDELLAVEESVRNELPNAEDWVGGHRKGRQNRRRPSKWLNGLAQEFTECGWIKERCWRVGGAFWRATRFTAGNMGGPISTRLGGQRAVVSETDWEVAREAIPTYSAHLWPWSKNTARTVGAWFHLTCPKRSSVGFRWKVLVYISFIVSGNGRDDMTLAPGTEKDSAASLQRPIT
jgi:hypothetical protein